MPGQVPIDKIDVFTDASLLSPTKNNPAPSGAWTAVVVEHRGKESERHILTGPLPIEIARRMDSDSAEEYAIESALNEIKIWHDDQKSSLEAPPITLYTDSQQVYLQITTRGRKGKHAPLREHLTELLNLLPVSIKISKGNYCNLVDSNGNISECMTIADLEANKAAWRERLKQQGHVYYEHDFTYYKDDIARKAIEDGVFQSYKSKYIERVRKNQSRWNIPD